MSILNENIQQAFVFFYIVVVSDQSHVTYHWVGFVGVGGGGVGGMSQ